MLITMHSKSSLEFWSWDVIIPLSLVQLVLVQFMYFGPLYITQYQQLFVSGQYAEAAKVAANLPRVLFSAQSKG
jgi:hypothetical protein